MATQNSPTAGFAFGVDQNKPVTCISSAASGIASTETPLCKQRIMDIMRPSVHCASFQVLLQDNTTN